MKKLALILASVTVLGAASPASAQVYFGAGDGGVSVGVGTYPSYAYGGWWGGPVYTYDYGWWGGPGYMTTGYWGSPGYAYGSYWSTPAYAYTDWPTGYVTYGTPVYSGYTAYAAAPGFTCRTVRMRQQLADGRIVIRRERTC